MNTQAGKIAVAMSGGVDSSTVAALLIEQGFEVIGITMRLWRSSGSVAPEPAVDAARVARQLGIPHHVLDLQDVFHHEVIEYFVQEYLAGRTPNPCAHCNRQIKFGSLLDAAHELGARYLATGHYARLHLDQDGASHLLTGSDITKDQSYFLFGLSQQQLSGIQFPLGDMTKHKVRVEAARLRLPVAEKSESQDVCFIPDGDYIRFLETEGGLEPKPGQFILSDGRIIGSHKGIHRYTVGQRRGMGIAWSEPLFVLGLDALSNQVRVGIKEELAVSGLTAKGANWIVPQSGPFTAHCKIRYRYHAVECRVDPSEDGTMTVSFSTPQAGVTPGQAIVFYHGDEVLGGGWIEASR